MKKILLHGTQTHDIDALMSCGFHGANGSHDGVGINLTEDPLVALRYAREDGVIHVVETDISSFLSVSRNNTLSVEQAEILKMHLKTLPEALQVRLATDICGKQETPFNDDDAAEAFYKEKRQEMKLMDLRIDRLMPEANFDHPNITTIRHAHKSFDSLHTVSTRHIHYCLNLFDNQIASTLLGYISKGLILERENGLHNFLSFRQSEVVQQTLPTQDFIGAEGVDKLLNICGSQRPSMSSDNETKAPSM